MLINRGFSSWTKDEISSRVKQISRRNNIRNVWIRWHPRAFWSYSQQSLMRFETWRDYIIWQKSEKIGICGWIVWVQSQVSFIWAGDTYGDWCNKISSRVIKNNKDWWNKGCFTCVLLGYTFDENKGKKCPVYCKCQQSYFLLPDLLF